MTKTYDCASVTWTINNIIYCWQKNDEAIVSPIFSIYKPEETKWKLLLFPRGENSDESCMGIYLYRDTGCYGGETMKVEYSLDILKTDGHWIEASDTAKFNKDMRKGFSAYTDSISSKIQRHLQQGSFVVRCKIKQIDGKAVKIQQINARTIIGVEKRFFQWPIEINTLSLNKTQSIVIKPKSKGVEMQINLTLTSANEENICFNIYSFDRRMKFYIVKTFIIDSQKQEVESGEFECWFDCGKYFPLTLTKKHLTQNKNIYLPDNILTLSFHLTVSTGITFEGTENTECECFPEPIPGDLAENWKKCISHKKVDDCPCSLVAELTSLFKDQNLCDMKLKTKTKIIPVHIAILGARSPVFRAMFSSDMLEKAKGCVDLSDFEEETVNRLLLYLYSDQLEDLNWVDAVQLFKAADKYAVISLRDKCSVFLKSRLNVDNACEALVISDLHQDRVLKEMTQNFILKNGKVIFKSEEWKLLADANSKLAMETMLRNWNEE